MTTHDYTLVKEANGYRLYRREDGKYTVVQYSHKQGQVYSAMPGDQPKGSGTWFARATQAGIDYVAYDGGTVVTTEKILKQKACQGVGDPDAGVWEGGCDGCTRTCNRCQHTWWPRSTKAPKRCPRCGSPYWFQSTREEAVLTTFTLS